MKFLVTSPFLHIYVYTISICIYFNVSLANIRATIKVVIICQICLFYRCFLPKKEEKMKAFVVYFIFLILQHATSLDTSTVKITSTENHPSNDLPTTDNPSTESNALPMIAGSEQPVGPDTYDFLNTPAILIDAPMDISTTTDATTTTIKPIDNPVVDPFAFYLTATCCDLRRCHTNMDCINYEDRWGCR
jgi:hypothetical protein